MADDLDFDFDDFDDSEVADLDDAPDLDEDVAPQRRSSPLRIILLVLLVLILACVVCGFGLRNFGGSFLPDNVASLLGVVPDVPAPVQPDTDTPTPPPPTDESQIPPEETEEPAPPATEEPSPVEPTDEPVGEQPTEEPPVQATEEPTDEPSQEPTDEPTDEPTEEPTDEPGTTPVPGPTSTPGPTVVVTVDSCDSNTPPTAEANGPYTAMMGKGNAFVTFDGSGSSDTDGMIESYEWDFGDGSATETGESVTHGYTATGSYVVTLTVTDNCGESSQDTADVTIVGPTPPASNGTPTATAQPPSASATLGFCYRVGRGDTLSGIAWRYGVSLSELAAVNNVSPDYFVIAGQGLFVPSGEVNGQPNAYEVQSGDTLNDIAYQCGLTTQALATTNGLTANAALTPGQMLIIPPWR